MKKLLFWLLVFGCLPLFGQDLTSKFSEPIRNIQDKRVSGLDVDLFQNAVKIYDLVENASKPGVYESEIATGEYDVYINGSLFKAGVFFASNKVALVTNLFNATMDTLTFIGGHVKAGSFEGDGALLTNVPIGVGIDVTDPDNIMYWDDFNIGSDLNGDMGLLRWKTVSINGLATFGLFAGIHPNVGYGNVSTNSDSADGGSIYLSGEDTGSFVPFMANLDVNPGWDLIIIFRILQTTDIRFRVGLYGNPISVSPGAMSGMYLRYDTRVNENDTEFKFVTSTSAASKTVSSAGPVDTNFHKLRIRSVISGEIRFSFDDGIEVIHTTNLSNSHVVCLQVITHANLTSRRADIDFFSFKMTGMGR